MPQMQTASRPFLAVPARMLAHRPRAAIPATAQAPIFTVRGGPVRVWGLVGKVTLAGDATVTNLSIILNALSGLTDVPVSSATAITSAAVGNLIGPQAAGAGSALTIGGAILGLDNPFVVDVGTIDLLTSATNVLAAEWFLLYEPLHPAARVTPVLPNTVEGYRSRQVAPPQLVHRAATALPQTAQSALFTVKGGPVRLHALWGKAVTLFGATATNLTIVGNSAVSGIADVNLCTATAVTNLAANSLMALQLFGIGSALALGGGMVGLDDPPIVDAGTIDWLTSGSNTGTAEWWALWEALHPSGRLVAA